MTQKMQPKIDPEEIESLKKNEDFDRLVNNARIKTVSKEIKILTTESKITTEKIKDLQSSSDFLKCQIHTVVDKVEQSVDMFRDKLSKKLLLILQNLSDKQTHIQCVLDNCYGIIANLVETFLAIGYELEKDIAAISLKVNDVDCEIKKVTKLCSEINIFKSYTDSGIHWSINSEGRLTKQIYSIVGPVLPAFKYGDKNVRLEFIQQLSDAFRQNQVPEDLWVKLASSQLTGMAEDWWRLNNKNDKMINWKQFCSSFIGWTFDGQKNGVNWGNSNFTNDNQTSDNILDNNVCSENKNKSQPESSCIGNSKNSWHNLKTVLLSKRDSIENVYTESNYSSFDKCGSMNSTKNRNFVHVYNQEKLEDNFSELKEELSVSCKTDCSNNPFSHALGNDNISKLFCSDNDKNVALTFNENYTNKRKRKKRKLF